MAIRTANKRAYLYGEGQKRQEWGISTVTVNSRRGGCPLCTPYIGKIFIDDVYSGGKKTDGEYPLLSDAIKSGLFHPNCKDSTSTYYEGITTLQSVTKEEQAEMKRREKLEQKQSHCENEAKKNRRIADHSLDNDNKKIYSHRAEQSEKKAALAAKKLEKTVDNSGESGIIFNSKVKSSIAEAFTQAYNEITAKFGTISTISSVEPLTCGNISDYGIFSDHSGVLQIRFADDKNGLKKLAQIAIKMKEKGIWSSSHPYHVFRHELGHAVQLEHAKNDVVWSKKLKIIKAVMDSVDSKAVSKYAKDDIDEFISECIAESMTKKARKTSKDVVNIILGGD